MERSTGEQSSDCIVFVTLINRLMKEKYIEEIITKEEKIAVCKQRILIDKLKAQQWVEVRKSQRQKKDTEDRRAQLWADQQKLSGRSSHIGQLVEPNVTRSPVDNSSK